ncbi:MAG: transporter substrate-binding domain-containing protein [Actinomycetota bacterium]
MEPRKNNWVKLLAVAGVLVLTLGACDGGDEDGDTDTGAEPQQIRTFEDLQEGDRVAVQRATTGAFWAEENLTPLGVDLVSFEKSPPMYQALQAGQVVAVLNDLPVSLEAVEGRPDLQVVQQIETGEEYAIAVAKANPGLRDAIDGALVEMFEDGTYEEIFTKYFPDQEPPDYSDAEAPAAGGDFDTIEDGVLTVGSDIPYPPFEFEENGDLTGFDVEVVRGIAERLGLENPDDSWISTDFGTIFQQLRSGTKFDVVVAAVTAYAPEGSPASETVAERRKVVDFSLAYYPSLQSLTINTSQ